MLAILVCRAVPHFSEDVCSESAVFKMIGSEAAFPTTHFYEDVPSESAISENTSNSPLPILGGMSQAKRSFLIKSMMRTYHFCEDVSSEIAILARLEGAPGGHIGARLGLSGALLMPLKIIASRC